MRRVIIILLSCVLVAGLVVGTVTGVFGAAAGRALYATGLWVDGGASTVPPGTFDEPPPETPSAEPTHASSPVLPEASPAAAPPAKRVQAVVSGVDRGSMGGKVSGTVIDVASGKALHRENSGAAYTPASTMKLLTSLTALDLLGPDHRFSTRVVEGADGQVILVGGGDPYLAEQDSDVYPDRPSVAELAASTAEELTAAGRDSITLGYDASLFSGPAWNTEWPDNYSDQVTPVSALWVDEGRVSGTSPGPREQDPAGVAGRAFADALEKEGIEVTKVGKASAAADAEELAAVDSMPVGLIVEQVLVHSDNDAAEVLLRQSAIAAGEDGSFAGGRAALRSTLADLGVWEKGTVVHDGSGLARTTKVPSDTMVKIIRLGQSARHPEYRPLITGLPVAGVEGSLRVRFATPGTEEGRGQVRGKTGTLRNIHSLAGYVRTVDGALLAFAFLVNDADEDYAARVWLDRVSAALAGCGCN